MNHGSSFDHSIIMTAGHLIPHINNGTVKNTFLLCLPVETFQIISEITVKLRGIQIKIEELDFFARFPVPRSHEKIRSLKDGNIVLIESFYRQSQIIFETQFIAVKNLPQLLLTAVINRTGNTVFGKFTEKFIPVFRQRTPQKTVGGELGFCR